MPLLYHHIEPDNFSDYGATSKPKLPDGVSFLKGVPINVALPEPLVFDVDYPSRADVPHFLGDTIPIFSDHLVKTLVSGGADNFQVFPAVLRSTVDASLWEGFWAFNEIGLVSAAKLDASEFDTLMEADDEGVDVPLAAFNELVLDKEKTQDLPMFRLAESPNVLLIHDRLNAHVDQNRPDGGWRFDATEIFAV